MTISLQWWKQTQQTKSWPYFLSLVAEVFWTLSVMRAFILVHGVLEDLLQCKVSMCKYCMFVQWNTYCVWHAFAYTLAGLGSGIYTEDTAGGVGEVRSIGHGKGEKR